jgi:hypothetical protein
VRGCVDVVPGLLLRGLSPRPLNPVHEEPARNPSFWTRRIHFVSEYAPVNGVWLLVRTVARVTVRWFGEYVVRSECGPYEMVLVPAAAPDL